MFRIEAFLANRDAIARHNEKQEAGYTKGVNQFTGVAEEEIRSILGGTKYTCPTDAPLFTSSTPVIETAWDWRANGAYSVVREQGF